MLKQGPPQPLIVYRIGSNATSFGRRLRPQRPTGTLPFIGQVAGLRCSTSARYDVEFQPERFLRPEDETAAVYTFSQASGRLLMDSSSAQRHGYNDGIEWSSLDE